MAVLDCTLVTFKVPGLYDYTPPFGTKNADGAGITTSEVNTNVMMPFLRQRPMDVTENSSTSAIESNVLFNLKTAGITLAVGEAAYNGCQIVLINTSAGKVSIILDGTTYFMLPGDLYSFDYVQGAWSIKRLFDIPWAEIAFAIGQSGLANYEVNKTVKQRIQSGQVTIYNRGVISGCTISKTGSARTVSMAAGSIFKDGAAVPMLPLTGTITIPENTTAGALNCYVYLNDTRQLTVTPLGVNVPADGISLVRAAVPAYDTQGNDADLHLVTFTSTARMEPAFPLISTARPSVSVVLPFNFIDTNYTVILETVSIKGPGEAKVAINVEGKALNGFNIYNDTYADAVVVRWAVLNEKI
jgi:hypothetical protein